MEKNMCKKKIRGSLDQNDGYFGIVRIWVIAPLWFKPAKFSKCFKISIIAFIIWKQTPWTIFLKVSWREGFTLKFYFLYIFYFNCMQQKLYASKYLLSPCVQFSFIQTVVFLSKSIILPKGKETTCAHVCMLKGNKQLKYNSYIISHC